MKKHQHHELFLHLILLLATVIFGAGLFAATNYPAQYRAAAASVPLADRDYDVSLPSASDILPDLWPWDKTLHAVGGWGCRMRNGTPYSILHWTSCF